jgi:hypothetical protein
MIHHVCMSKHLPNLDPHQHAADVQAEKDVKLNAAIVDYFANHLDAYPAALFMVATTLKAAIDSPSCGGDEPRALRELLNTVCNYVHTDDPASLPLVRR